MEAVTQGENDANNELLLSGRNQALAELLTLRNQPFNEINALRSGTQMGGAPGGAGVAPTDTISPALANFQNANQNYQNTWNALGTIGSTVGGWIFGSDERLKTNIHSTGAKTRDGIPIKSWRYKGEATPQIGVVAQDVARRRPDAVERMPSGYRGVDYGRLGLSPPTGGPMPIRKGGFMSASKPSRGGGFMGVESRGR